jgi:DNA transformation protein
MTVSATFRTFALEQLSRVTPESLRSRAMFGGVGVYAGERFFALMDDDTLYLKAGAETRARFVDAGMPAFAPYGDDQVMQYYAVPADLLESPEDLREWVDLALSVATTSRKRRPRS